MINSVRISTGDMAVQNRNYINQAVSMNIGSLGGQRSMLTVSMHLPLSISHGLSAPHLKAKVKKTGNVQTKTMIDVQKHTFLCDLLTHSLFRNSRTETFVRLRAIT